MVKISKKNYDRGIKFTEIIILILFSASAILMSISQDNLNKSNEILLTNIENFEHTLIDQQSVTQSLIYHLVSCNTLKLAEYVQEIPTPEFLVAVEEAKQDCLQNSLGKINGSILDYSGTVNETLSYKISSNESFVDYKRRSQKLSQTAVLFFILGLVLCFFLVLDLIIFEPKPETRSGELKFIIRRK